MPETTVFDHYEVLRRDDGSLFELGRGAMGITYKAFDTNLRCPVALKVINAASIHSDVARQRFVREARAAAALRHRHVASVFHLGLEGDIYFYAMEFIAGETVESLVRRQGRLEAPLALKIATQVARALNAAQQHKLVHRDIKPSNLMLVREDEELVVKVIDFGLAKSSAQEDKASELTLSVHGFVGTPHFASPEQLEERDLDARSDIYSLGVTLWYMLAGQAPFTGTIAQVMSHHLHSPAPLRELKDVPEPLQKILARMLAKNPADRPQTPLELRGELERCLEAEAGSAAAGKSGMEIDLIAEGGEGSAVILKRKGFYAGAVIGGRYALLRDLGESSCGWSFQAEDAQTGGKLRLIVLQAEWAADGDALTQIEHEVEKVRGLEHPNILHIYSVERAGEASFLLMEWTDGFSLLDLLRARQELAAAEAMPLLRQLAAGVEECAVRGCRHLDFSLHQIFLHFPGNTKEVEQWLEKPVERWPAAQVKVNPLGITREFATSDTWAGGQTMVGDFAPAARDARGEVPARRYVQSLAAVAYELLGGSLSPLLLGGIGTQAVSRYTPLATLPEEGNEVLKQALDPARSFGSAQQFAQALEASLGSSSRAAVAPAAATVPAKVVSAAAPKAEATKAKRPLPWVGLAVWGAAALAIAAFIWRLWSSSTDTPRMAQATPAPVAQTIAPTPSPTPDPDAPLKARVRDAERYETAHDWARALATDAAIAREFPASNTGRVRLERLFLSLGPMLGKMSAGEFEPLRPAVTEAARLGVIPAIMTLADHLRKTAPGEAFAWYCDAAARQWAPAMTQAGLMVSNGAGGAPDLAKAAAWFQMAANLGDAPGRACLAECYLYGTGVPRNERHAVELLQGAADAGDPRAMDLLGTCFHRGLGTAKNYEECLRLFSRAHELGFQDSAGNLGVLYANGDGVSRNPEKAVELFSEGARNGSAYCMYLLAVCLESGTGIPENTAEAQEWYRKAAGQGNPMALGWCGRHHVAVGKANAGE